ncbi:hypothetical protein SCUP234_10567 [Seiridium cupressi]
MGQQDRFSREYYPNLGPSWGGRGGPSEDPQYNDDQIPERKGAPMPLQQVLREYARIPVKTFFMAAILEDGSHMTFCTPNSIPPEKFKEFYDATCFKNILSPSGTSVSTPSFDEPAIPYRRPAFELNPQDEYGSGRAARKRRANFSVDEVPMRPITRKKRSIVISDTKQLWQFYELRFKNCQQAACKLIAKAWIKTVEPKKQSTHPYTGKDEKAPDWWPQPWGDGQENKVRHKEPDHLYKRERLRLLCHILTMIIQPNEHQHSDITKLQLTVAKLEEVTWEALNAWFADNTNPANIKKKAYLEEIFKVAKQEERFRAGMIDGSTKVHVSTEDRINDGYASDTEDNSPSRLDDGVERMSISRSITPHKGLPQDMASYPTAHGPADNSSGPIQGAYMNDFVLRGAQYSQPIAGSDFHEEVARYGEVPSLPAAAPLHSSGSMGFSSLQYMPAPDPSRRASMSDAHSEFTTPPTAGGYDPWANSSGPSNPAMYSLPATGYHSTAQVPAGQSTAQMTQPQQFPILYEGMPRNHDPGQANMYRSLGPIAPATGYPDYGHPGVRGLAGPGVKQESFNKTVN